VFLDDDLLPSNAAFEDLISASNANPNQIIGKWGRTRHLEPFYDTVDCAGACDVVLTKFMIVSHTHMNRFFAYANMTGLRHGLAGSVPVWNGEDIFMSLVNSHCEETKTHRHLAIPSLDVVAIQTESGSQSAISGDIPKGFGALIPTTRWLGAALHWWYRGVFWHVIVNELSHLSCA
jgi:hypothetical protein